LLGWSLLAAGAAGLLRDHLHGSATPLGTALQGLGASSAEDLLGRPGSSDLAGLARGLLEQAATWPAWVPVLAIACVFLGLARWIAPRAAGAGRGVGPGAGNASDRPDSGRELTAVMASFSGAYAGIGVFSGISNVLMLTGSFFMLEVYDRVLPSRSLATLVAIAILAAMLFMAQGVLDLIRARMLSRIGVGLDEALSPRIYDAVVRLPLRVQMKSDGLQPIRDLDTLRGFLSGHAPQAFFDLPWMPLYLFIIYLFHPILGLTALVGVAILIAVTLLTEMMSAGPTRAATEHGMMRNAAGEASRRNAEVMAAMGMAPAMQLRWDDINRRFVAAQQRASDVTTGFGSLSRVFRMMLQSAVLGVGAWLVIKGEASAGVIIAGSILASRALAPVELAIANWRGFVAARQSWQRLRHLLRLLPPPTDPMPLPPPRGQLSVEAVAGTAPGEQRLIVQDITFALKSGDGLAVMGPSASGKSTLARVLVGVWPPVRGHVRLDGASLDQWSSAGLGRHVGYLPQDVELFAGTIAQNIARFDPAATPEAIVAAAKAAGVHELIVALKDGYEYQITEQGRSLSAGQQQRVALARALYGDPFLVVLDEPNSNLDADGDRALTEAILKVRARGGIAIVVAHRPSAIAGLNQVLALAHGRQQIFGPKDEVLAKILRPPQGPPPTPIAAAAAGATGARPPPVPDKLRS
jgi:ATP-binding cassette subfamily C protein